MGGLFSDEPSDATGMLPVLRIQSMKIALGAEFGVENYGTYLHE